MFFRAKPILGLDIGSSGVKVVELVESGGGMKLLSAGFATLPSEAIVQGSFMNAPAISSAIRDACDEAGVRSKDVATSVSGHSVIVKKVSLPMQSSAELEETIRWEAEQYIPFDINEVNIDYQILDGPSLDGQMDVILVAAKKDLIDNYQSVIADAGLGMAVMDVDAFAMGNMYCHNYAPTDQTAVALVDIGASVININVMNGSVPVFTRDVTSGGNQYTEEIQKALNVSFEDAELIKTGGAPGQESRDIVPQEVEDAIRTVSENLFGEIVRSLDFHRATTSDNPISRVILCGGSARIPGLERMFEERAGIPAEVVNPFERIDQSDWKGDPIQLAELAPSFAVAVGLGMRRRNES